MRKLLGGWWGESLCSVRQALAAREAGLHAGDLGFAAGRFALSCPRMQGELWQVDGQRAGLVRPAKACALAPDTLDGQAVRLWAGAWAPRRR